RRFRLLRWSLFGLALVGLGFLLREWLSPWPRLTISTPPFQTGFLSGDGASFVSGPRSLQPPPGIFASVIGLVEGPCRRWDLRSGRNEGTFFAGKKAPGFALSSSHRYLAVQIQQDPQEKEPNFHLVNLVSMKSKPLFLEHNGLSGFEFSPQESFLL